MCVHTVGVGVYTLWEWECVCVHTVGVGVRVCTHCGSGSVHTVGVWELVGISTST